MLLKFGPFLEEQLHLKRSLLKLRNSFGNHQLLKEQKQQKLWGAEAAALNPQSKRLLLQDVFKRSTALKCPSGAVSGSDVVPHGFEKALHLPSEYQVWAHLLCVCMCSSSKPQFLCCSGCFPGSARARAILLSGRKNEENPLVLLRFSETSPPGSRAGTCPGCVHVWKPSAGRH